MTELLPPLKRRKRGTVLLRGLRRVREDRDLSMSQLAERAGVSKDTIWRLENGHRGAEPSTRQKLALAMDAKIKDLKTPDEEASRE